MTGIYLRQMRNDAALEAEDLAHLVFGSHATASQVLLIEQGEAELSLWQRILWFYFCSHHVYFREFPDMKAVKRSSAIKYFIAKYGWLSLFTFSFVLVSVLFS